MIQLEPKYLFKEISKITDYIMKRYKFKCYQKQIVYVSDDIKYILVQSDLTMYNDIIFKICFYSTRNVILTLLGFKAYRKIDDFSLSSILRYKSLISLLSVEKLTHILKKLYLLQNKEVMMDYLLEINPLKLRRILVLASLQEKGFFDELSQIYKKKEFLESYFVDTLRKIALK
ncbi:hypothetical protein CWI38_1434p0020 [Hamiltosporidium tvaerminnensis]|uniref:Uncharacterized protein n=1 Tax=Hamiltosporidium tvaerminnensis TaxID=1176355 RepID=A0A4Q9LR07_9MICR|nr:hypothetical protein CWI38_1434p0020 [Hamiltosporidium tvaerminnensis]